MHYRELEVSVEAVGKGVEGVGQGSSNTLMLILHSGLC